MQPSDSRNKQSTSHSNTSATLLLSVSLAIAGVAYILVAPFILSKDEHSSFNVTSSVSVKVLKSPRAQFARSCAEAGVPIVLRNSVTAQWRARHWTPKYLEKKLSVITGVYKNSNRWFGPYFDQRKPLLSSAKRVNEYTTNLELPAKEFFHRIQHPDNDVGSVDHYLYFTGDIDQLGEWAINEVHPVEELLSLNPQRSSINVWIGQPHVIAHCHYDGYHNFYAQLYGKKKFILIKPTNWPGLFPYPFLHPSHAQAQVNVSSEEDRQIFPLVGKVEALEVILEPGDLLYIPPLWFHEVESLDVSISVNVWTDSEQTKVAEKLFELPLPIHAIQWSSTRAKRIATSILLFQTLLKICTSQNCVRYVSDKFKDSFFDENSLADTGATYFIHRLWTTRYRTLMERKQLPRSLPLTGQARVLCEGDSHMSEEELAEMREAKIETNGYDFGIYAQHVGQMVQELPSDSWELWVGNYVEFIVANAVSDVKYVGVFLEHFSSCLLHD